MKERCKNCLGSGFDSFRRVLCDCTVGVELIRSNISESKPVITIEDVKRLVINPGEVLLVRLPEDTNQKQVETVRKSLAEIFKDDKIKVILHNIKAEFTVVKATVIEQPVEKDDKNYCGAV
jgi:hypothetical protein